MSLAIVSDVRLFDVPDDQLRGFSLEAPTPGSSSDIYSLPLSGWVVGTQVPVVALDLHGDGIFRSPKGTPHWRLPVGLPRKAELSPQLQAACAEAFDVPLRVFGYGEPQR